MFGQCNVGLDIGCLFEADPKLLNQSAWSLTYTRVQEYSDMLNLLNLLRK